LTATHSRVTSKKTLVVPTSRAHEYPANVATKSIPPSVAEAVPVTSHNRASVQPASVSITHKAPVAAEPAKRTGGVKAMDQLAAQVVQRRCGCKTSTVGAVNVTPPNDRRVVVPVAP
jgi:hypothetical protein